MSSDFNSSPLVHLAREIADQEAPQPQWRWTAEFKVLPESGMDFADTDLARTEKEREGFFQPLFFTNLDFIGNFEKGFCDHVNCTLTVGMGLWLKVLSPHREQLRIYLTRERLLRQGGEVDPESDPLILTFKPLFKDNAEAHDVVGETLKLTRTELDMRGILTLDIDLLDAVSEFIQSAPCGGTYRKHTTAEVMQGIFAIACEGVTQDGEPVKIGQVIADRTNEEKREHITVQAGFPLVHLPTLLQQKMGGIWPTGCSRYMYNRKWYFFPPYDTTRVERERVTLTIVRVPEIFGTGVKHTYLQDGDQLKLIAASDNQIKDMTQTNFLQQGDGVRFAKASAVMSNDWMEVKDNKAIARRSKTNTEVRIKADGQTDHRTMNASTTFTDNPYREYSELAARRGQLLSFSWSYADHTLITPGMPCRVLYEDNSEIVELHGVVVGRSAAVQTTQQAASTGNHITTCALFVFCNEPFESNT